MTYTFPWYVPGIAVGVAVLSVLVGVILYWKVRPRGVSLVAFGVALLAGGLVAPMLALDRVVLDDEKLEQTTGFWFAPTVKGFRLEEARSVTIGRALDGKNREYEVWIVEGKNGGALEIDPGDLWVLNGADIVARLREKGIEVRE